jgi:hypothetical protein
MAPAVRTDDLIARLAREAGPVPVLAAPRVRAVLWYLIAAAAVAGVILVSRLRPDAWPAVDVAYGGLLAIALGAGLFAAATAFVSSVPGADRTARGQRVVLILLAVWGALLAAFIARSPAGQGAALGLLGACETKIAILGLVPGGALILMLRRAMPLRPAWTGALAGFAAASFASVGTQLICPSRLALHGLLGHFLPVILIGAIGALAGRRLLGRPLSRFG